MWSSYPTQLAQLSQFVGRENAIKLNEVVCLFYYIHYMCLGEETLNGCYTTLGAPFVNHKSVGGRRKSIHPGAGLTDITLAAANHARVGTPLKETEVLFVYFSCFCLLLCSLFNSFNRS
jgi:hypothetical protein